MSLRDLDARVARWTVQALTRTVAAYALLAGLLIIKGGPNRWHGASYATALSVPGAPATWGWALLVCGLCGLVGTFYVRAWTWRVVVAGLVGVAAWCLFFAASFALTAVHDDHAATTGVPTYLLFSVLSIILAVAYLQNREPR